MSSRILVVDDEESIRFSFESILAREGYSVITAADHDEVSSALHAWSFDLIFADIVLGGWTGIDLLRDVKRMRLTCPVVIITGVPSLDTATEAVRLGAYDYISKPLRKDDITGVASSALRFKAIEDEKERYRRHLETIFRGLNEGVALVDGKLRLREFNGALQGICGFRREDIDNELSGQRTKCSMQCLDTLKEVMETREPGEMQRIECHHRNRNEQIVSLRISPVDYSADLPGGAVMIVEDETSLVHLESGASQRASLYNIIGKNDQMQLAYNMIERLADVDSTVLITGESGTGKELVAEALHHLGYRRDKPFIKLNCSALNENLLESELFGHVKGSFTGAYEDKPGRFEIANGGTLFLDEVGDMPLHLQVKLLRVLQEHAFERVGGSEPIRVDVRVMAATNHDLRALVAARTFREDLFYRLKVVEVNMPPLRKRLDDLPLLVEHFTRTFGAKLEKPVKGVSNDVMQLFKKYSWPGNVRELEHCIECAMIMCSPPNIKLNDIPEEIKRNAAHKNEASEGLQVYEALIKAEWNKSQAANMLGISRPTLYKKIIQYNLESPDGFIEKGVKRVKTL